MDLKRVLVLSALVLLGVMGCSKEQKVEAPTSEQITKHLVPSKTEIKGPAFLAEVSDLKTIMTVDIASKEITETPKLTGDIKITNKSKDILDIQAVTLEYLDEAGNPIAFSSGEKVAKVYSFWKALKPEEVAQGTLDATIPRRAVKEKALGKIEINIVYVPSPLKREILTLPEKIE
jgi:hypothetical protein